MTQTLRVSAAVVALGLALSTSGCGHSVVLRAAESGDFVRLRAELAEVHKLGTLSRADAIRLAHAVASHEIRAAKDETSALARLSEVRACAADLDDVLAERMGVRNAAGAQAALMRLEGGELSERTARKHVDDADDRWRAVGVWTLHRSDDGPRRRTSMLDPSPLVRRSAIVASRAAEDVADLATLFETARVDPELLLRNEAVRSISAIARSQGRSGEPLASKLALDFRDLWTNADDALKEELAVAWGLSPVFEAGGRHALRSVLVERAGPGPLAAAGVVLRTRSADAELAATASAEVAGAIALGSRRDRLHAIAIAKTEGAMLDALRVASRDADIDVKVAALVRLLELTREPAERDAAKASLLELARAGASPGDVVPLGRGARARQALAAVGEIRVQAWLERDLAEGGPEQRLSAVTSLALLGRLSRGAPLLGDADPSLRTRAACAMLVASHR
jgi:hypothetical protein